MKIAQRMDKDRMRKKYFRVAGYLVTYLAVMVWGMAVVKWQVPPYGVYVLVKQKLGLPRYMGPDAEVSKRFAFISPLVEPVNQIDPPVQNMEQVNERVRKLEMDVSRFPNAYESLRVINPSFLKPDVFSLSFEIGRTYTTYCYFEKSRSENSGTAFLLIPGSGFNQSSALLPGGVRNYHDGIFELARKYGDVYVYIKPNEDIRAIHNGHHKLDYDFITNTLIGHGGSYSAYYLVEAMAITKYLRQKYGRVVVAGVSQGGAAAALVGFQAWPDIVLCISGGYYPSDTYIIHASPFNIMIPGMSKIVDTRSVADLVKGHPTRWLYTNGKSDIGGFRVLAEENLLSKHFHGIGQVTVATHAGGHEVPTRIVDDYLSRTLSR